VSAGKKVSERARQLLAGVLALLREDLDAAQDVRERVVVGAGLSLPGDRGADPVRRDAAQKVDAVEEEGALERARFVFSQGGGEPRPLDA
jgi:hypothetical protein